MKIRVLNTVASPNLTGNANVGDVKAAQIVDLFLAARGAPLGLTDQQKVDFAAAELKSYMLEVAKGENRRQRRAELEDQIATDVVGFE